MSEPDVTEALNSWLSLPAGMDVVTSVNMKAHRTLIERARDEIVALREMREAHIRMLRANEMDARAKALEEAANIVDDACLGSSCRAFRAIRALKDKQ